jgi:crotonobetainyl-CoA:carnitine CoA-transferase CaiB-like acyl-CoA transferase
MSSAADAPHPGPLSGIRVLELSLALTGPYIGALFADQGADVVKVERPDIGDILRWIGPSVNGLSAVFRMCNRGKRSIAMDVRTEAGREIALELAARADVVIQNFRPGVANRLGLGYEDVTAINPDVVYVSLTGFGEVGPYRDRSAYDTVIQAYGGVASSQAAPMSGSRSFYSR